MLRTIQKIIPEYADHAVYASVLGQVEGSASANPLLVAGSAGLFGKFTKAAHHKIKKKSVKPGDVLKAGQQISNYVPTTEKIANTEAVQYA